MSIFNFVSGLLPRIDRSAVLEDLRITEKECINAVMPSFEAAETYFKTNKPESPEFHDFELLFYQNFDKRGGSKAPSVMVEINKRLPMLRDNISHLKDAIQKLMSKDIINTGLTAKQGFMLRAASNISMITRYSMALLNYLYTMEAQHHGRTLEPGLEIAKAEIKYVEENIVKFARLFSSYAIPEKEFVKLYTKIPEIFLNDEAKAHGDAVVSNIDPLAMTGISGFIGNPIYQVRMIIAKWQNDRYESTKAKKQQLELRLLYLQMKKDDGTDPLLAKEISRLQERIEGYDRYLREVEEEVAA